MKKDIHFKATCPFPAWREKGDRKVLAGVKIASKKNQHTEQYKRVSGQQKEQKKNKNRNLHENTNDRM